MESTPCSRSISRDTKYALRNVPDDASPDRSARPAENDAPARRSRRRQAASIDEARAITEDRARDLQSLLKRYVRRHLPPPPEERGAPPEPPSRRTGGYARALPILRAVPYLLAAVFGVSLLWDFPGARLSAFGTSVPLEGLLRIVSVSGLIGFATNWLAITMLFHPREERPIFGQGLLPAQRERVVYRLAQAVSDELINADLIKARIRESAVIERYREKALDLTRHVLEDPDFRRDLKAITSDYVERVLASPKVRGRIVDFTIEKMQEHTGDGLSGLALRTYRFFNEEDLQRRIDAALRELPDSLDVALDEMDALLDRLPAHVEAHSDELEKLATRLVLGFVEKLDVYDIIVSNMQEYDERRVERLFKRTSNEQLTYIKYLGGVLGFFGGLVIWQPVLALTAFTVVGGALWALDVWLMQRSREV